ncbi:hypothetical protein IWX49DRAFT_567051 [Phyllosticta citricarpa]
MLPLALPLLSLLSPSSPHSAPQTHRRPPQPLTTRRATSRTLAPSPTTSSNSRPFRTVSRRVGRGASPTPCPPRLPTGVSSMRRAMAMRVRSLMLKRVASAQTCAGARIVCG